MLEWLRKLGLPEVATAHGLKLDEMLAYVHWLMLVLFVGWGAFYILSLVRFRAKKHPRADYGGVRSHASSYLEVTVAILEAVLIVGFAIPLWAERVSEFPTTQNPIEVRVVAEQFAWNMHYPGKDGKFGKTSPELVNSETNPLGLDSSDPNAKDDLTTINQLHLPVNRPAIVQLSSKDVIHSFGIPEFRVKQDAMPGMVIPVWFTPTVTTAAMRDEKKAHGKPIEPTWTYEIACAQLCGLGHYRMRGFVTIHEPAEFDTWLAAQTPLFSGSGEGGKGDFWE